MSNYTQHSKYLESQRPIIEVQRALNTAQRLDQAHIISHAVRYPIGQGYYLPKGTSAHNQYNRTEIGKVGNYGDFTGGNHKALGPGSRTPIAG